MPAASLDPSVNELVTFTISSVGPIVRVAAVGEIDSSSAPAFRGQLDTAFDGDVRELVVDLAGVTFLDSAGLSVLAGAHRRAGEQGVTLRVLAANRAVARPLQITGLWALLGVEQVEPGDGGIG